MERSLTNITMDLDDVRIEKPVDPTAPKTINLALARQLVRNADKWLRNPGGQIIGEIAAQLGCALDALDGVEAKITAASNNATRYQRESEQANKEVLAMQGEVASAREQIAKLTAEVESLRPKAKKIKSAPEAVGASTTTIKASRGKPGPKPKVVAPQRD